MGLLDSDAEELKKSADSSPNSTSGRKVNQSGLGAFKGLSKYSKLTDKYRAKSELTPPGVEHRGTVTPPSPSAEILNQVEVSAKPGQSEGNVGATTDTPLTISKPVQSTGEVRADIASEHADITVPAATELESPLSQGKVSAGEIIPLAVVLSNTHSAGTDLTEDAHNHSDLVSAKSVHATDKDKFYSVDSQGKVSADILLALQAFDEEIAAENNVSAKPVQSGGASKAEVQANDEPAKPVQSQFIRPRESEIESKTKTAPANKSVQSGGKASAELSAIPVQIPGNDRANSVQGAGKVRSIVSAPVGAKLVHKEGEHSPLESITSLAGAQRITIQFLFNRCLWNNSLVSPPITKQQLIEGTQLKEETVLSAVKRLRLKNILDRHAYKDGKSGWTQYRISEESYRELLQLNQYSGIQSQGKVGSEVSSELSAKLSSSSSSINNKNTTTTEMPEDWAAIDYSSIESHRFGRSHLLALYRDGKLSAEEVQRCIHEFDFDVRVNKRVFRTGPLNAFMGILRKGQPYVAAGYESPEEVEMKENLQRLKAREKEKQAREQELIEIHFREWMETLSPEMKKSISPFMAEGSAGFDAALKGYFLENFWAQKKGTK